MIKDDGAKYKGSHGSNPSVHARKKPNRRKSTGALSSKLESYTLPDFAYDSGSTVPDGIRRPNSPADSCALDASIVSNSSGSDSDILDRAQLPSNQLQTRDATTCSANYSFFVTRVSCICIYKSWSFIQGHNSQGHSRGGDKSACSRACANETTAQ